VERCYIYLYLSRLLQQQNPKHTAAGKSFCMLTACRLFHLARFSTRSSNSMMHNWMDSMNSSQASTSTTSLLSQSRSGDNIQLIRTRLYRSVESRGICLCSTHFSIARPILLYDNFPRRLLPSYAICVFLAPLIFSLQIPPSHLFPLQKAKIILLHNPLYRKTADSC